ncbi:LysM peptidoglycan-binding domain-containing protein [uncultured Neptuniibacter sp.]|uniref:LysM peptidoglycan-binding domain-containing protein n=1 Tax=uncultured Neptuniibacter sp. TaxID=502143 RepID=UPI00261199BB|nr:LysM peptidoglycan-binding domain-containing protein [uncultured Neptuniibacter sp.]
MLSYKSVLLGVLAGVVLTGCQTVSEKTQTAQREINNTETPSLSQGHSLTGNKSTQKTKVNHSDLWQLTRSEMQLALHIDKPRVKSQLNWYKKHPQYFDRIVKRATPYYYYILNEAIRRDIPVELALLPIVESAYDPFAYSHGRAAGPWQFIPSTGKHFGLRQDWWYDGRRDIISSTQAAYNYLEQLQKRFDGDWLLALAAYNAGGGNISKAIKRNRRKGLNTDYWSLDLPKETMAYVPKLLAISELIKHSDRYNLQLKEIPNEVHFAVVDTHSQIDMAQAASLAGISTKELYLLNPGFNRWATSPSGPHRLLVPHANATQLRQALVDLPDSERVKWARYKIKSGDSLISIAKKHETTVQLIRSTNNISGNNIRAGSTLLIPTASKRSNEYALSQHQRHLERQKSISRKTNKQQSHHIVKSGDSFWSIAKKYRVGVRQLARWNSMAPGDPLNIGKRLVIWTAPQQKMLSEADRQIIRKVGYKVRNGDSLSRIASKFNVNVSDILRWNKLSKSRYLQPGQRLTLYVDVTRTIN